MFCFKCGTQIPDDSVFCLKCGARVQPESASSNLAYILTFDRASQIYAGNPPIKVLIDGNVRLSVDNGESESVSLAPGLHRVELSGSIRSNQFDIDLQEDMVIKIGFSRLSGKLFAERA